MTLSGVDLQQLFDTLCDCELPGCDLDPESHHRLCAYHLKYYDLKYGYEQERIEAAKREASDYSTKARK